VLLDVVLDEDVVLVLVLVLVDTVLLELDELVVALDVLVVVLLVLVLVVVDTVLLDADELVVVLDVVCLTGQVSQSTRHSRRVTTPSTADAHCEAAVPAQWAGSGSESHVLVVEVAVEEVVEEEVAVVVVQVPQVALQDARAASPRAPAAAHLSASVVHSAWSWTPLHWLQTAPV